MQRNIMKHTEYPLRLEKGDEPVPLALRRHHQVIHMIRMFTMLRNDRTANPPLLRPGSHLLVVIFPNAPALLLDRPPFFQLAEQKGSQDVAHEVTRPNIHPGVFIHLSFEKSAAVSPLLPDNFRPLNEPLIIEHQGAPFSARDVFRFMKALSRQASERSQAPAAVLSKQPVRIVLDDCHVMSSTNLAD